MKAKKHGLKDESEDWKKKSNFTSWIFFFFLENLEQGNVNTHSY